MTDKLGERPHVRRVVCAANRHESGTILLGARHWDGFMHATHQALGADKWKWDQHVQGFIDNEGNFLTRREAFEVARVAGQLHERFKDAKDMELFSEDLY